jgi:hypothetical protein
VGQGGLIYWIVWNSLVFSIRQLDFSVTPPASWRPTNSENVGSQFLSLRRSFRNQHSPRTPAPAASRNAGHECGGAIGLSHNHTFSWPGRVRSSAIISFRFSMYIRSAKGATQYGQLSKCATLLQHGIATVTRTRKRASTWQSFYFRSFLSCRRSRKMKLMEEVAENITVLEVHSRRR